ncbi:hypothetical protein ACI3L1_12030 [Deinococcus sp. SM5_A1]|uniref:hypothetical protein n=1 Tax=Deinococcus sp. SM5_A1 TaxID=3379094 RepID=UPI00385D52C0
MTLPEFETIEYRNPALNLSMICEEDDGEWTGEMPGPEGEILVRLPASSAPAPDEASLETLRWALARLPELRREAMRFARTDVLSDLNRWGSLDKDGKPYWETYDEMRRWPEMDEAAFSAEFVLMGLIIPEEASESDCILGFHTEVDGEHGVGVLFRGGQPEQLEFWCNF